jgi:hypothetical protein
VLSLYVQIVCGTLGELLDVDFGAPLHCLVIVGETHPVEKEVRLPVAAVVYESYGNFANSYDVILWLRRFWITFASSRPPHNFRGRGAK